MVVGSGLLASVFEKKYISNEKIIIFASGVSNSKEIEVEPFMREELLLKDTIAMNKNKTIVYFSSTNIYDSQLKDNAYSRHKLKMENLIKNNTNKYYIFRLSEVVGKSKNQYQLLNFFNKMINNEQPLVIWKNACRHLIDIDDVYKICNYILENNTMHNEIINIANPINMNPVEILKVMESTLGKSAVYSLSDIGECYEVDIEIIEPICKELNIIFSDKYLPALVNKYYGS